LGALGTRPNLDAGLPGALEAFDELVRNSDSAVLVVVHDGEVIATVQLMCFRLLQHGGGRCGELESLQVAPSWRGRGIGSQLLTAAVALARELGCSRVQCTLEVEREDAHRFCERHGFTASHRGFTRELPPA